MSLLNLLELTLQMGYDIVFNGPLFIMKWVNTATFILYRWSRAQRAFIRSQKALTTTNWN